jgi:hypothetical protein
LQHILPTQIANNIATTEKSENQLQVLDFIEVHPRVRHQRCSGRNDR